MPYHFLIEANAAVLSVFIRAMASTVAFMKRAAVSRFFGSHSASAFTPEPGIAKWYWPRSTRSRSPSFLASVSAISVPAKASTRFLTMLCDPLPFESIETSRSGFQPMVRRNRIIER